MLLFLGRISTQWMDPFSLDKFYWICLEVFSPFFLVIWVSEWKSLSCVWLFATPWIVAHQTLLCLWDSPGKNNGVGCHCLSRGSSQTRDRTQLSCFIFFWFCFLLVFTLLGSLGAGVCVTASTIPLRFSLGWIWRAKTGKHLRRPETLTEK